MRTIAFTPPLHTKGPWHIELAPNGKPFVTNKARQHVCTLYEGKPSERVAANARLIAASPDLLAACETVCGLIYRDKNNGERIDLDQYERADRDCRAAVAKATEQAA